MTDPNRLHETLGTTPPDRLRSLLKKICAEVPEARRIACDELSLLLPKKDPKDAEIGKQEGVSSSNAINLDGPKPATSTPKPAQSITKTTSKPLKWKNEETADSERYVLCKRCSMYFDTTTNEGSKGCCHHPGAMKVNNQASIWLDVDSGWGRRNQAIMRESYPDGFTFRCCGKIGTAKGCTLGPHEAKPTPVKGGAKRKRAEPKIAVKRSKSDGSLKAAAGDPTTVGTLVEGSRAPLGPRVNFGGVKALTGVYLAGKPRVSPSPQSEGQVGAGEGSTSGASAGVESSIESKGTLPDPNISEATTGTAKWTPAPSTSRYLHLVMNT